MLILPHLKCAYCTAEWQMSAKGVPGGCGCGCAGNPAYDQHRQATWEAATLRIGWRDLISRRRDSAASKR